MNRHSARRLPSGDIEFHKDGPIRALCIENILDVEAHEITREAGLVSHLINFREGSAFRTLFDTEGRIQDLVAFHINLMITPDNRLIRKRCEP